MTREFKSADAFKNALEAHLRKRVEGDFSLERQRVVFTRFLARLSNYFGNRMILKGGFALELRVNNARTTQDIDLAIPGASKDILKELQSAGALELDDYMIFEVSPHRYSEIKNDSLRYEGQRFRIECKLANKIYGRPFSIDVIFDKVVGNIDLLPTKNYLDFSGGKTFLIQVYSIEMHIAEKLHAYCVPKEKNNSRIKDFPDLAILASLRPINIAILRTAVEQTFNDRNTHSLPVSFPLPSKHWKEGYEKMAQSNNFKWENLEQLFEALRVFINPILNGTENRLWDPHTWRWR